jgi:conjugal transfer mating pair stabilization protein TraN
VGETKKGVFHQKKKHYCCFHSKLARIAQVGGRQQLGKDFGKSHAPICDGLSIEELERIQWSAIDFSEVVQDFAQKVAGTRLTSDFQQKAAEQVSDSQKSELSKLSSGLNSTIHSLQNDFPDELNQYYKEQSND